MSNRTRIGTSGWVDKHWRGIYYPQDLPQRRWFEHYAAEFDTVEINNSFYRLPSETTFDAWREQAPPDFVYAVKASRFLTHIKRLQDPEEPLALFLERAKHLEKTLGPVLYQLPPRWHLNLPRFEHFLKTLSKGVTHVVEFRDPTWFREEVFELMERHQVAHCIHDMPPLEVPLRATATTVYVRFHGGRTHEGNYSDTALELWADRIREWEKAKRQVFVYFNNDPQGYAIKNARTLKRLLE
jgi:uncharacterized protein YecE (DUF72 family)